MSFSIIKKGQEIRKYLLIAGKYKRQQWTAYSLKHLNVVVTKKTVGIKICLIIFYQHSK